MNKTILLCLTFCMSIMACDSKKTEVKEEPTPSPTTPTPTTVVKDVAATPAVDDKTKKVDGEEKTPEQAKEDTGATDTVVRKAWNKKFPEKFDLKGTPLHFVSWTDKTGTNGLGISLQKKKGNNGLLLAKLSNLGADGTWTELRGMKELVDDCSEEMDLDMDAYMGKAWSLTDLDKDGIGEVTFAWSRFCGNDVRATPHKVFILEGKDKYALRGTSRVRLSETRYEGGSFKPGAEFQKAPKTFLAHAKKVWKTTSDKTK